MREIITVLKKNWFIAGIFAAVLAGYYFPVLFSSINRGGWFSSSLVVLLFFIQGLILPAEKLIKGIKNPKLHIFIQIVIFVIYPLFFYAAVMLIPFNTGEEIKAGLFALACI